MKARRERGFALLIVLWSLVLIGLLITQLLASGRSAVRLANNVRLAAEARASADGAIYTALYHVLATGADRWAPDDSVHVLAAARGGPTLSVRIKTLDSQINPNKASTRLLAGLFQAVGASPAEAQRIGQAITDWRSQAATRADQESRLAAYRAAGLPYAPPGRPFADLSELRDVLGMPPALLDRAMPFLNLYQSGDPNPDTASPTIRRALAISGQSGNSDSSFSGSFPAIEIDAEVKGPGPLDVRRRAIVSLAGGDPPYQMLAMGAF